MCDLPDSLVVTTFFPMLLIAIAVFVIITVYNNWRNGRKLTDMGITKPNSVSPSDKSWQLVRFICLVMSVGTIAMYAIVTATAEDITRRLGECNHPIPGRDMWPAAVVFSLYSIASTALLLARFKNPPLREVFATLGWGFFSLAVGFFVTVYSTNQALLVWLPTLATVLPVLISLGAIYRQQIKSFILFLATPPQGK